MINRKQLYRYRGNVCSCCGKSVEEMVLRYGTFNRMFEFHHIDPSEKHSEYSKLMKRTLSSEQIDEVDKCVLLCRECHSIVHAQNIHGYIEIRAQISSRKVTQKLNGWFVIDSIDKTLKFLSNNRHLLQPCFVTLGSDKAEEYLILEILQNDYFLIWLRNLEFYQRVEVTSALDGTLLLEIVFVAKKVAKIRVALGFPLLEVDFDVSEGDTSYLWLRNGMVLTKEGELMSKGEIQFLANFRV